MWIVWQHEGDTFGFDQTVKKHSFCECHFWGVLAFRLPCLMKKIKFFDEIDKIVFTDNYFNISEVSVVCQVFFLCFVRLCISGP